MACVAVQSQHSQDRILELFTEAWERSGSAPTAFEYGVENRTNCRMATRHSILSFPKGREGTRGTLSAIVLHGSPVQQSARSLDGCNPGHCPTPGCVAPESPASPTVPTSAGDSGPAASPAAGATGSARPTPRRTSVLWPLALCLGRGVAEDPEDLERDSQSVNEDCGPSSSRDSHKLAGPCTRASPSISPRCSHLVLRSPASCPEQTRVGQLPLWGTRCSVPRGRVGEEAGGDKKPLHSGSMGAGSCFQAPQSREDDDRAGSSSSPAEHQEVPPVADLSLLHQRKLASEKHDMAVSDQLCTALQHVFMTLPATDLLRAAQVCRRWRDMASSECFRRKWGLGRVDGYPGRLSFWRLEHPPFVLQHRLRPLDSLSSLAVHYGCQPASILRMNRMMSDHSIHTRRHLFVPITEGSLRQVSRERVREIPSWETSGAVSPGGEVPDEESNVAWHVPSTEPMQGHLKQWLRGKDCSIKLDVFSRRDVAIVEQGELEADPPSMASASAAASALSAAQRSSSIGGLGSLCSLQGALPWEEGGMNWGQGDVPLTDDLLLHIFMGLATRDVVRAAQVCVRWRDVANSPGLHAACFRRTWGLERVEGSPSRLSFWRLDHPPFVLRHSLRPCDSVTSVAVQYGCQPASIRRLNNMMSDHAIHTRSQLLVPTTDDVLRHLGRGGERAGPASEAAGTITRTRQESEEDHRDAAHEGSTVPSDSTLKSWLQGKSCFITLDIFTKRDVAIVQQGLVGDEFDDLKDAESSSAAATRHTAAQRAAARAKVVQLLVRAFGVDEPTAAYYLEQAGGDVRVASQELRSDMHWEKSQRSAMPP